MSRGTARDRIPARHDCVDYLDYMGGLDWGFPDRPYECNRCVAKYDTEEALYTTDTAARCPFRRAWIRRQP